MAPLRLRPTKPSYHVPPREVIAAAQNMQRRWGVPASVSLAQWAVESRWGAGMPEGSNNPFGIKAGRGQPSVQATTTEYRDGKRETVAQYFRKFPSLDAAWESRSRMLATDKRYAKGQSLMRNPDTFVDAIAPVYAPGNPIYAKTIKAIMRSNHLYQYDTLPDQN